MSRSPTYENGPFDFEDNDLSGLIAKDAPGNNAAPLSISEISSLLKRTVEERFGFVRLRGELSGVKRAASGHLYCSLKDDAARIDGVMWKGSVVRLPFQPEDGLEVIATGKLTTYPGRSNYQIVIERMEIAGEGALLALLAKTKARLESEGLFSPERKRAIPFLPRVIGVVTSPTGAVIRDILHRLADRFPSQVLVWPVLVQGQGAADQIAAAVRGFSALEPGGLIPRPDLIIVARGGGSIEDLWAFNEEVVVRAVADCTIPVISAVGHETDTTLVDYAADHRAPTPTAAAERAVPVREDLLNQLGELALRKRRAVLRPVTLGKERLSARSERLPHPETLLEQYIQRLDDQGERLRRGLADRAAIARGALLKDSARLSAPLLAARIGQANQRLSALRLTPSLIERRITEGRNRTLMLTRMVQQLNPERVLQRGYAIVRNAAGKPVLSAADAAAEAELALQFADGRVQVFTSRPDYTPQNTPQTHTLRQATAQKRPATANPLQGKLL